MKVSIFGLGHAGAVSAACLASLGHSVTGLDTDANVRRLIGEGRSPTAESGLGDLLRDAVSKGRLAISDDPDAAVRATELSLVCVGTPAGADGALDVESLVRVSQTIGAALVRGHTVVVRSTMLPGTMRSVVVPILEKSSGLRANLDFDVAVAPEFLREGTAVEDFFAPAQIVVGARDAAVAARVGSLFHGAEGPLSLTSIEAAEMAKYASNIWHGLKIAFANEIGGYCQSLAIDPAEVMRIFTQDRKLNLSERYLQPGFAFGGPCLMKDIEAFMHSARQLGLALPVMASILPSNQRRIDDRTDLILRTGKRAIGFLGLGYKPDTDDIRSSPYLDVCRRLIDHGRDLRIFDPYLSSSAWRENALAFMPDTAIVASLDEALAHGDLIVIGTPHEVFADVRSRLSPGQSLIDLALGTHQLADGARVNR